MNIYLESTYKRAGGILISPGEYDIDAPALRGLGEYLVKTRHAFIVPAGADDVTLHAGTEKAMVGDDLDSKTIAELTALTESLNLEVQGTGSGGRVTKRDLVFALRNPANLAPVDDLVDDFDEDDEDDED